LQQAVSDISAATPVTSAPSHDEFQVQKFGLCNQIVL